MGDLISAEMLADLLINIINIVILFLVTKKLVYKPVKKMLEQRKQKAVAMQTEAQNQMDEAGKIKSQYEEKLRDFDEKTSDMKKQMQQQSVEEAEKIIGDAKHKAEDIVSDARSKAEEEKEKMLSSAKNDIVDAAIDISGRIIGRNISDEDNKKIIDSFFGEQGQV